VELIKIDYRDIDYKKIDKAAQILEEGGLVVFPTETVYGLGANASRAEAVSKIYKIKKRPENKPLSLHIAGVDTLFNYIEKLSAPVEKIIDKFWPGPLTVIINTKEGKKGFRMPDNKVALELIERSGVEVVAPSANISGELPPKDVNDISESIKRHVDIIIDIGRTKIGIESTVIDATFSPYRILREGSIRKELLNAVVSDEDA